jgi:hypothetical protein
VRNCGGVICAVGGRAKDPDTGVFWKSCGDTCHSSQKKIRSGRIDFTKSTPILALFLKLTGKRVRKINDISDLGSTNKNLSPKINSDKKGVSIFGNT